MDPTGTSKVTFLCTVAVEWNLLDKARQIRLHEEFGRTATIGAEMEKLLSKSMTGSCASAIQVIMDTGARPKDVCQPKIQSVDFERGVIFIETGKTRRARRFLPMSKLVPSSFALDSRGRWALSPCAAVGAGQGWSACGRDDVIKRSFRDFVI